MTAILKIVPIERLRNPILTLAWISVIGFGCGAAEDRELDALLRDFQNQDILGRQAEVGHKIAEFGDPLALRDLEPWLKHNDRRIRGNTAYVFAEFGDARGLETLHEILDDYSEERTVRLDGFISILTGPDESSEELQQRVLGSPQALRSTIKTDRYYAVHLLGSLRDPGAVEFLIPLLSDDDLNYKVAWALEQIKDDRATSALIDGLSHPDASVRVPMILALKSLNAKEALPFLAALIDDPERPRHGYGVTTVGQAAREAIVSIQSEP